MSAHADLEQPSQHARLSASNSDRWLNCSGAIPLADAHSLESKSSYAAAEGTLAHDIAAHRLKDPGYDVPRPGAVVNVEGFDIEVTEDMLDAVDIYVKYIDSLVKGFKADVDVEVDFTQELRSIHPDFGGTADAVVYVPEEKLLVVVDYKHGAGVYVNVVDNRQAKYYALGALLKKNVPVDKVRLVIVQPRFTGAEPVREYEVDTLELLDYSGELLEGAARVKNSEELITAGMEPVLKAGDHCKFCPARHACPELKKHQQLAMANEFSDTRLAAVSPKRLAEALEVLPAVEDRIKAIREHAYDLAAQGHPPPGWKLVDKRALRKYADENKAAKFAVQHIGDEAWQKRKLKTPAQLETALPKDMKEMVKSPKKGLITKTSSGYNLVPEDDPRRPAQLASPDDFEEVK